MKLIRWVVASLFVLVVGSTQAALIDNGTYTTDTASGLDWLDVTTSVNMSYNYVSSQFVAGGVFEGWRYATADDLLGLVVDFTGVTITMEDTHIYGSFNVNYGLANMLGITYVYPYTHGTVRSLYGLYDLKASVYGGPDGYHEMSSFSNAYSFDDSVNWNFWTPYAGNASDNSAHNFYGSFLVRDVAAPVPEPETYTLMLATLAFLSLTSKRRKHTIDA